jgi:hypothetical protein
VFLGEAAQSMVQNADYEIPYLRKQLAKSNQQVLDADRKQDECAAAPLARRRPAAAPSSPAA